MKTFLGACATALPFSGSLAVMAQTPPPAAEAPPPEQTSDRIGIADIVVTAQKREQRLQDVPVAVSALSEASLTANRIQNVRDLDAIAPNLTVRSVSAGSSLPTYTMRGLVSTGSVIGSDKGVAIYIDGVYLGAATGSVFDLADIQRIEVLRGPQGTLFGRNSTAGAISITQREPDGQFRARQTVTYGNYDQFRSVTSVSTPQIGPFSAIVSYIHNERRGDIRNLGAGTTWDFSRAFGRPLRLTSPSYLGDQNSEAVAIAIRADISPSIDLLYRFDYNESEFTTAGQGIAYAQPVIRGVMAAQPDQALMTPITDKRPKAVNNAGVVPSSSRNFGHSLTARFTVSDRVSIKNVAAYRKTNVSALFQELSGAGGLVNTGGPFLNAVIGPRGTAAATLGQPLIIQATSTAARDEQWSNELQVNVDLDAVTLTTGLLYYRQKATKGLTGEDTDLGRLRAGAFNVFPNHEVPFAGQRQTTGGRPTTITIRSLAAYAQAEFHVTPQIDLIAGARITGDKKGGLDRTLITNAANLTFDVDYKKSKLTYGLGVNYKPTDEVLVYAKYSTGFISGTSLSGISVEPETAKSWEFGLKADWFDRLLRTNLALFHVKYDNLQLTASGNQLTPPRPEIGQALLNAGDAKAKGFELEATLAPAPGLVFNGAVGYTDFKYTRLLPLVNTNVGGFFNLQRPEWTMNYSAQYDTEPLFGDVRISARMDANWKSKVYHAQTIPMVSASFNAAEQEAFRRAITADPYWIVNSRLALQGIALGGGEAEIALWARNLLDNRSVSYGASIVTMFGVDYERARTYGADVTIKF